MSNNRRQCLARGPLANLSLGYYGSIDRSKIDLNECENFLEANWDRSQFAFERSHSHSDRFELRSISDRSNSLVWTYGAWMAPIFQKWKLSDRPNSFVLILSFLLSLFLFVLFSVSWDILSEDLSFRSFSQTTCDIRQLWYYI